MTNNGPAFTDDFSARNYLEKYFRKKLFFIFSIVISVALTFAYLWLKTPLYQIQSTLVIKDEKKGESNSETLKELDFLDEQKIVDNEAEIIKSATIIGSIVERLSLDKSYAVKHNIFKSTPLFNHSPVELKTIGSYTTDAPPIDIKILSKIHYQLAGSPTNYKFGDTVKAEGGNIVLLATKYFTVTDKLRITISAKDLVTQNIKKNILVSTPSKNSSVINISMLHPSREAGSRILFEILKEYNQSNIEEKKKQTDSLLKLIEGRISSVSLQLGAAESSEETFKSNKGITTLSDDSRMFLDKVKENDKNISETKIQLEILSTLSGYVNNTATSVAPPNPGINDPYLLSMVNKLNQLQLEKETLSKTTGNQNPLVLTKLAQINEVKRSISQNLELQKSNLNATISQLMTNKRSVDANIGSVPASERKLLSIVREKSIRESIYLYLLQKREEASIADAAVFSKMRIIDNPYSSIKPVKPNKIVVFLTALLAALLFPALVINLLSSFSNKVISRKMITDKLDVPLIGEIATMKKFEYLVAGKNKNIYAEQLRRIRTQIERLQSNKTAQTILVTSSLNAEGKTFVASNLALSFAMIQKKTVLIDFDFTFPKIHSIYEQAENNRFNEYLSGTLNDPWQLAVPYVKHTNLHIISNAGAKNEADGSEFRNLEDLFGFLKNNYEIIILNSLPYRIFSEPLALEKYCDLSIINIRHNVTTKKSLDYLNDAIQQKAFRNPVLVYNDVPLKDLYDVDILKNKYFTKK